MYRIQDFRNAFAVTVMALLVFVSSGVTPLAAAGPGSLKTEADSNQAPVIDRLGAVLYGGLLYVAGKVRDADDDPAGQRVFIGGSVVGMTYVQSNGMFYFRIPYTLPYGEVTARTIDRHGADSNTAIIEFAE